MVVNNYPFTTDEKQRDFKRGSVLLLFTTDVSKATRFFGLFITFFHVI